MKRGVTLSVIFHLFILILAYFGLPSLFEKTPPEEQIVSVELLPVQSVTNVKPQMAKEEEKKEEKKSEPPKPEPAKEKPKPTPPPPKPEEKEAEEKKPEPIKPKEAEKKPEPEKKPEAKKENPKEEDFDSVLKNVEKMKPKEDFSQIEKSFSEDAAKAKKGSSNYDPTKPLSASEIDAIKQQIYKCWSIPAGAKDAKDMKVRVRVSLDENGGVINASIMDSGRYNGGDPFYVSFADSAVRAVRLCSPLKDLPKEKYSTWKDIELNFDPSQMIY